MAPVASIVIPTRGRPQYLELTLESVMAQAHQAGAEVLVVSDGPDEGSVEIARRHGARHIALASPSGVNAVRNAGLEASEGDLVVLIDDDVEAPAGWLRTLVDGAAGAPAYDVFGGPIRARLEGSAPYGCGREPAPITTLDLGPRDRDAAFVWGANMAIRRRAIERIGPFDPTLSGIGDEEDWEARYAAAGGSIRYLAQAGLDHRRSAEDSRLRALARSHYRQGRAARRNDVRKATAPPLRGELRTLAGCVYHVARRRCAVGIVLAAHAAGRLHEALAEPSR